MFFQRSRFRSLIRDTGHTMAGMQSHKFKLQVKYWLESTIWEFKSDSKIDLEILSQTWLPRLNLKFDVKDLFMNSPKFKLQDQSNSSLT